MIRSLNASRPRRPRRACAEMIRVGPLRVICAVRLFAGRSRPARRSLWPAPKR